MAKCTTNCNENTHGTGDTFSACIAAELAKGTPLEAAIVIGKQFIQGAISQAISVGHGHGPTNHWAQLTQDIQVIKDKRAWGKIILDFSPGS